MKHICVFCSSSDQLDPIYVHAAATLGGQLAQRGWTLVYGGGHVGTMGTVARAVQAQGGRVIGVIPESMHQSGLTYTAADEVIVTPDMHQRKARMEALADAFVVLPGGFGTLEEALEVITLKQLHVHAQPVVFVNINTFFDPLLGLFEQLYRERFAKEAFRQLYGVRPDTGSALAYIEDYVAAPLDRKW